MNNWQEIHNKKARENPGYVASMHPKSGWKEVAKLLWAILAPASDVFEYGVWPGMNAIRLAKMGHKVDAQDVSDYIWGIFLDNVREEGLKIPLTICLAQDHVPEKMYDAFVCTSVLHFMPQEDARRVIATMQAYTRPGGYNALEIFTSGTQYDRPDRFYVSPEELKTLYPDWIQCHEITWSDKNVEGHEHVKFSLLLQKPCM